MIELARQKNKYIRKEISKLDAISYFQEKDDEYKLELLEDLNDGEITFYTQGEFTDLCRGPHIPNTGSIKAVKITSTAGAYWRGDENRQQLTRLYGITFPKAKELKPQIDKVITIGKKNILSNKKRLFSKLQDKKSVTKVFDELSKRYSTRKGGYSRVLKAGFRTGDDAPMAVIELVDRNPEAKKVDKPKKTETKNKKKEAQPEPKVASK